MPRRDTRHNRGSGGAGLQPCGIAPPADFPRPQAHYRRHTRRACGAGGNRIRCGRLQRPHIARQHRRRHQPGHGGKTRRRGWERAQPTEHRIRQPALCVPPRQSHRFRPGSRKHRRRARCGHNTDVDYRYSGRRKRHTGGHRQRRRNLLGLDTGKLDGSCRACACRYRQLCESLYRKRDIQVRQQHRSGRCGGSAAACHHGTVHSNAARYLRHRRHTLLTRSCRQRPHGTPGGTMRRLGWRIHRQCHRFRCRCLRYRRHTLSRFRRPPRRHCAVRHRSFRKRKLRQRHFDDPYLRKIS